MSDFGHVYSNSSGIHVDGWGAGPFIIMVAGRSYRFEDSDRFGPYLIEKKDQILERQPREGHPFWRAHRIWVRQGRRVDKDDISCVWHEPKPTFVRKIAGRLVTIVSAGEEDGEVIVLQKAAAAEYAASLEGDDTKGAGQ